MELDNASTGSYGEEMPHAQPGDVVLAVFLGVLSLFGAVGNCLTILAVLTDRQLRSQSSSYLIVNLAVADMVVFVVIEPFLAFSTATYTWPFSVPLCASLAVLVVQHMVISVCCMTTIAVNRYFSVVRRTSYPRVFTSRRTLILCLATWLFGSAIFLPLVTNPFYANYSTYYGICVITSQDIQLGKAISMIIALNIVINIVVSSVCYLLIYREVRRSRLRVAAKEQQAASDRQPGDKPDPKNDVAAGRMAIAKQQINRADVAISLNLFIVFAVFCVCWTPLAVLILIQTTAGVHWQASEVIPDWVWQIVYKLVIFNSTLNIFIYAWKNRNLRAAYAKLLRYRKCR